MNHDSMKLKDLQSLAKQYDGEITAKLDDGEIYELHADGLYEKPQIAIIEGKSVEIRMQKSLASNWQKIKTVKARRTLVAEKIDGKLKLTNKVVK